MFSMVFHCGNLKKHRKVAGFHLKIGLGKVRLGNSVYCSIKPDVYYLGSVTAEAAIKNK